jgi:hypothetical protein
MPIASMQDSLTAYAEAYILPIAYADISCYSRQGVR